MYSLCWVYCQGQPRVVAFCSFTDCHCDPVQPLLSLTAYLASSYHPSKRPACYSGLKPVHVMLLGAALLSAAASAAQLHISACLLPVRQPTSWYRISNCVFPASTCLSCLTCQHILHSTLRYVYNTSVCLSACYCLLSEALGSGSGFLHYYVSYAEPVRLVSAQLPGCMLKCDCLRYRHCKYNTTSSTSRCTATVVNFCAVCIACYLYNLCSS